MIRRNALIFHSGGLGDFVLTWPLGLALGRLYPQSRIIYITAASKGELAAAAIRLDWRDSESSWPALYSNPAGMSDKSLRAVVEAHSVFTFMAEPGDAFCQNIAAISPQAAIVPLRLTPPADFHQHATEYLLGQLSASPAVAGAVRQILSSIHHRGLGIPPTPGGPILIHPGSGSREKCWPVECFLRLIEKLGKTGCSVNVLLGEVELERFTAADIRQMEGAAVVIKPGTYVDLYRHCAAAAGFIGNDSGPAHLAGIMGLPTVALFGPSDTNVWQPLGPGVTVLHHSPLADLTADEVFAVWKHRLQPGI